MKRFWRILHNVIVHPLMEVLPDAWGEYLHEETGKRAFED